MTVRNFQTPVWEQVSLAMRRKAEEARRSGDKAGHDARLYLAEFADEIAEAWKKVTGEVSSEMAAARVSQQRGPSVTFKSNAPIIPASVRTKAEARFVHFNDKNGNPQCLHLPTQAMADALARQHPGAVITETPARPAIMK